MFTIFGQGRQHQWSYVIEDKEHRRYFLDERSVRQVAPATYSMLVQMRGPGGTFQSRFTLDMQRCTLQKENQEPLPVRPGTVAEDLRQALARRLQKQAYPSP